MKDKNIRCDIDFEKELREIIKQRISLGLEQNPYKPTSTRRITLAIKRHSLWQQIKQDIIKANLTDDYGRIKRR